MQTVPFIKLDPAGNTTVLFALREIDWERTKAISAAVLAETHIHAEQAGAVTGHHLQMMGGEFCGNASRAFGVWLAHQDPQYTGDGVYTVTCSGAAHPMDVWVRDGADVGCSYLARIAMPKAERVYVESWSAADGQGGRAHCVDFDGITHIVVEAKVSEAAMEALCALGERISPDAYGVMFLDRESMRMHPYVKVAGFPGVWENSCGSGTTAAAYVLREVLGLEEVRLEQPGGWLSVSFVEDTVYLDGPVRIVANGSAYIEGGTADGE